MIRKILVVLALAACHQAPAHAAVQTCTPVQMAHVDINDDHGVMCLDTARVLVDLVRAAGWRCDTIVGSIMWPQRMQYFVTCKNRANEYRNFASVGGAPFEPAP